MTRLMLAAAAVVMPLACSQGDGSRSGDTVAAINVAATPAAVPQARGDTVIVYKSPTCGCCSAWVDHMKENGFPVVAIDTSNVDPVKRRYGVRDDHASCHTALVGGYVIEGHVPAADIRRLLATRPAITGLAVPGMPVGSPGMEGLYKQRYQVLAFTPARTTTVFAQH